jgi:flagellar motor switch/type III secretory pathway protein FliN
VKRTVSVRQELAGHVDPALLETALAQVLGGEPRLYVHDQRAADAPPDRATGGLPPARVYLASPQGSAGACLAVDNQLAARLVARLLGRSAPLDSPQAPLEPMLEGALSAVAAEIARRVLPPGGAPLCVVPPHPLEAGLELRGSLLYEDQSYAVGAWLWAEPRPTGGAPLAGRSVLGRSVPGELEIELPVVIGLCLTHAAELASLAVGDAWSCGQGWWIAPDGTGTAVLAPPGARAGVRVAFPGPGQIVLGGETVQLPIDVERGIAEGGSGAAEVSSGQSLSVPAVQSLEELVADAPVVVRVELGAVSMLAREWAALRPGDVVPLAKRVAEPAVLRVAGREVARGELVDIDGELGVRIRELANG